MSTPMTPCPRCKTPQRADAAFCSTCGASLTAPVATTAPAPPARRRWLLGCAGLVVLIALCGMFSNLVENGTQRTADSTGAAAGDVASVPTATNSATSSTIGPTAQPPTATADPTATPPPTPTPLPAIGQDVVIDEVRWKVLEATDAGNSLPSSNSLIKDATTPGRFIRVRVEIENTGKEEETYDGFVILDGQGREFNEWEVIPATAFVPDEEACGGSEPLRPNIPRICQLIFEVAADASGFKAKISPTSLFTLTLPQEVDLGF